MEFKKRASLAAFAFTVLLASLALQASAQEAPPNASDAKQPAAVSARVADVVKMFQAGVSKEVIRTYIENSPTPFKLEAVEIIELKRQGVPDELTTALLTHRGAAAPQPSTARSPAPVVFGGPDPDSYAYFYQYYLHPRALAAAYQRLGVYGQPWAYYYSPEMRLGGHVNGAR